MTLHVRPSRPEDAADACQVVRDSIEHCCAADHESNPARLAAWLRNKTPDNFLAWLERGDLYGVVAEDEAGVAGFGMVSIEGELLLCYAAPSVIHQGAGKAMLQAMEQWATATGLNGLRLESTQTALAFYGRHGFVASGPSVSFAGMTSQPMRKALSDATPAT